MCRQWCHRQQSAGLRLAKTVQTQLQESSNGSYGNRHFHQFLVRTNFGGDKSILKDNLLKRQSSLWPISSKNNLLENQKTIFLRENLLKKQWYWIFSKANLLEWQSSQTIIFSSVKGEGISLNRPYYLDEKGNMAGGRLSKIADVETT